MNETLGSALTECREILKELQSVSSESEQIVMAAIRTRGSEFSRMDLYSLTTEPLTRYECDLVRKLSFERAMGSPLQYVLGYQKFFDHEYRVNPSVLIPRPETECLVEIVSKYFETTGESPAIGLEVGLGSGAISIELLSHFQELHVFASEWSENAILTAEGNAESILGVDAKRLTIFQVPHALSVLESFGNAIGIENQADFLVSNPPYMSNDDEIEDQVVEFEPREALFPANGDPLHFYGRIAQEAREYLKPTGKVFLEIPHERSQAIQTLFVNEGWSVQLCPDLTGRSRVLIGSPTGSRDG